MRDLTISERMKALIDSRTEKRGKFTQLEELTDVPAESWKSFYYGKQRPNPDMVEALCQAWPEYAFWVATGITDSSYGHIGPGDQGYPDAGERQENSAALFRARINCKKEATHVVRNLLKAMFKDNPDHLEHIPINDQLLRRFDAALAGKTEDFEFPEHALSPYLGVSGAKLLDLKKREEIAEKVRKAELLIHNEMAETDEHSYNALRKHVDTLLLEAIAKATNTAEKIDIETLRQRMAGLDPYQALG